VRTLSTAKLWQGEAPPEPGFPRCPDCCVIPHKRGPGSGTTTMRTIGDNIGRGNAGAPVRAELTLPTHQNSYSFPGSGITVDIPGNSLAILDSNQETAGGSPCTKITILGEIFRI
jgi:hypothetical protein